MLLRLVFCLAVVGATGLYCAACRPNGRLDSSLSDYVLYPAALADLTDSDWDGRPVVLDPRTFSLSSPDSVLWMWSGWGKSGASDRVKEAFRKANERSMTLADSFPDGGPLAVLDAAQQRALDEGSAFWPEIREAYGPGAIVVRFSRPGLDQVNGEALLTVGVECGPRPCGEGYDLRLRWTGQVWRVEGKTRAWSS